MRIVHVTTRLSRAGAGVRQVVLNLARAQTAAGHAVQVIGIADAGWEAERTDWDGIDVRALAVKGPAALGYAPDMTRTIGGFDPDIVHLHGLWTHHGRSVLQWHRATRRPYVVSVHGMLSDVALSYSPRKKALVRAAFQNRVFRCAAALHATSDAEAAEIAAQGFARPVVQFPNGVDAIPVPDVAPDGATRTVLSLGRIHSVKGLGHLVDAWARLEPEFPDWRLVLAGPEEDGEGDRLRARIAQLGLTRVNMPGPVYGDAKRTLMAQAGIFALPSLSENFALTVAESLMLGVPVVASHGAPWADLDHKGCGRWVAVGAAPMAAALRDLMEKPVSARATMGQRGRDWMMQDFTWAVIADRCVSQYRDVIVRPAARPPHGSAQKGTTG